MAAALIVSPVIKCFQIVTFACTRRKGVIAAPASATFFLPFDGRAGLDKNDSCYQVSGCNFFHKDYHVHDTYVCLCLYL